MIRQSFDPAKPYRFARYARMSSDQQNPRSPEQQFRTIEEVRQQVGHRWVNVRDYRDDAKSGKFMRNRPGFKQMLDDIRTGTVQVDLILVDTLERFGRMQDLDAIRRELQNKHGVLVVTADTRFADPTSPQGRVFGVVEAVRASEDSRVKAHNVRRGKRDAALRGHWPGGAPPFGFCLKVVLMERRGHREVARTKLEPDPESAPVIRLLFEKARESGFGQARLARYLNDSPDVPDKFKPIEPSKVGRWLDNPVYAGSLMWDRVCTDVVDDRRVTRRNVEGDMLFVADYCEPIVSRELFDAVHALRTARRQRVVDSWKKNAHAPAKLITPLARGITVKNLLTGLVRCGHCARAMRPCSSRPYVAADGSERRYCSYVCPGHFARICRNNRSVPEPWLRTAVVAKIQERLFADTNGLGSCIDLLLDEVRDHLRQLQPQQGHRQSALQRALDELRSKAQGWTLSLGKLDLDASVRGAIEQEMTIAFSEMRRLEAELTALQCTEIARDKMVDRETVVDRLNRLHEVLAANNPTMGNLELSMHVDRIDAFSDGRVVMRTCRLGALTGVADVIARDESAGANGVPNVVTGRVQLRRRARIHVDAPITDQRDWSATVDFATDPDRFAGLDERWFWNDAFRVPEPTCWAKEHAAEVADRRKAGLTHAKLAEEFGKTMPTIRHALRIAAQTDETLKLVPRKIPRARWHEEHANEVASLKAATGMSTDELARHFRKCDTTILAALEYASTSSTRDGAIAG